MKDGEKVVKFIEKYCRVPEGKLVGKPLKLAPFQKKFIRDIYDNPHGTRRALLSISRKNGKSGLIASLMLAHIVGPMAKLNSQVVSGAMSRDQAALVFNLAAKMLQMSPELQGLYRIIPSKKSIVGLNKNVEYRAMAADGTTAHGLSPVLAILDEVGQIRGPMTPFVEAIITSQGAHDAPLLVAISTQAPSDADMFSVWIDDAKRSGDQHTVCHVYAAEEGCDLMDEKQWHLSNPGIKGGFRSVDDLREQLKMASRVPSMEASVRNLILNQRISQESLWLAPSVWKENRSEPDPVLFVDRGCTIGMDLSSRNDLTAAVLAARDDEGFIHLIPYVFCPADGLKQRELRDKSPYTQWVRDGHMIAVPGSTVDYDWVCGWLRENVEREAGIVVNSVQYDRWRIADMRASADRVGFAQLATWSEVGQGYRDFSPRIESFESLLLSGKIRHGSHPLLNMAAANAIVVSDPAGNRKVDKSKSTLRIDPLVAAVMAAYPLADGNIHTQFDVDAMVG